MHIAVDFETFYSKKLKYTVKTMIAEEYCKHELFGAYLISVFDGTTSWAGHPRDFNWSALSGHQLVSHNAYFDRTVYGELHRRKLAPAVDFRHWACTANLTSFLCNRRALAQAVEYLYQVNIDKGYRLVADGKHWPQDFTEAEQKQVIDAGKVDAQWCWRLWNDYVVKWPEIEQHLSDITIKQGMRGVQINTDLLNEYMIQAHEMRQNCEKLIPWIRDAEDENWDEFNTKPTATTCIAEMCRREKIPCPPVKSKDEEGYQEWEDRYSKTYSWIGAVSAWRSVNKLYKTFETMKRRLRSDGTMPFGLKYAGAHTLRWAGDAGINFQNMRKHPLFADQDGLMIADDKKVLSAEMHKDETGKWPDWVKWAIDFRALIIPRPGTKMIASDLAQIEPRVLAWLSGNTDMLKQISGGMSVYEAFARAQMGYTGGKMDKRSDYYKLIKIQVLQLGYGAGWQKFITTALKEYGVDLTEGDPEWIEIENPFTGEITKKSGYGTNARKIVENFRSANPKIIALWERLDDAFRRSLGGDFKMTLPSGRVMKYDHVKAAVRIVKDPETGKPKRKHEFTADVGGRRRGCYGGLLTENITQAVARDVFAYHMSAIDKLGWTSLFSSHDEIVIEADSSLRAVDVEHVMSQTPPWLPGCPIAAEAKEIVHYLK